MKQRFQQLRRAVKSRCKRIVQGYDLICEYWGDLRGYSRSADPGRRLRDEANVAAYAMMLAHSIEKGLSLPNPRAGFGAAKVRLLINAIRSLQILHKNDEESSACFSTSWAVAALEEYRSFSRQHCDPELMSALNAAIDEFSAQKSVAGEIIAGRIEVHAGKDLRSGEFAEFFKSRHSFRQFTGESVDTQDVLAAVEVARFAPSVCNRQSARVHIIESQPLRHRALELQGGNSGFGHLAGVVIAVTSDRSCFLSNGERNQCWVDGGLFAMSLLLALHSRGLGTCCLNWCVSRDTDQILRADVGIPDNEAVIMLIAVGKLPAESFVASSPRLPVEDLCTIH